MVLRGIEQQEDKAKGISSNQDGCGKCLFQFSGKLLEDGKNLAEAQIKLEMSKN